MRLLARLHFFCIVVGGLLAGSGAALAQVPAWQQALSGPVPGTATTHAVAVNAAGDVFITGSFTKQAVFGSTILASAGFTDVFVAKWNAATGTWAWAVSGGGSAADTGYGIAVSGSSVYVTGNFVSGTSVRIAGTALVGAGDYDIFVAKYTDNGASATGVWAIGNGGGLGDTGHAVAVSGTSLYVTGSFASGTGATLAGMALAGAGGGDMFLAKYTDNGASATGVWATSGGGASNDGGSSVAVSGSSVYVVGGFSSGFTTRIAGVALYQGGLSNMFVAKYVDSGTTVADGWAAGSSAPGGSGGGGATGVAVQGSSVYITGGFLSNSFTSIAGRVLGGAGGGDIFLAKYIDGGSSFANGWVVTSGGTGDDAGHGIAVSGTSVYVSGGFGSGGNAQVAGRTLLGAGDQDVFVARYTDTGSTAVGTWASAGGGPGADVGYSVAHSGSNVFVAASTGVGEATFGTSPVQTVAGTAGALGQLNDNTGAWVQVSAALQGGVSSTMATATDVAGNVYVTGYFAGQMGFDLQLTLSSAGDDDIFLAKWDSRRRAWLWAVSGGGTGKDRGIGLAVSGSNVYVAGYFTTDPSVRLAGQPVTGAGGADMFVAKYIDNGATVANGWATSGGGSANDQGLGVAVSGSNVYTTGYFASGTGATFAGMALAGAGSGDLFVAKYTDNGTTFANGWATSGGGTGLEIGTALVSSGPNVYVTGFFQNNPGTVVAGTSLIGAGVYDILLAKYTDNGATFSNGWAVGGGGIGIDVGNGIAVNGSNVYVTGYFASGYNARIAGTALAGAGNQDMFVAKYIDNGSSASDGWATSGGGTSSDRGQGIAVRGSSVYVAGGFTSGTGSSIAGTALPGAGLADIFVARYTDTGPTVTDDWAISGGGPGFDNATGLSLSGTNLFVSGNITPRATFGPLTIANPTGTGSYFLGQIGPINTLGTAAGQPVAGFILAPNPANTAATLTGTFPHAPITILDPLGRPVLAATADAGGRAELRLPAGLAPGLYLVKTGSAVRRLVVE